MLYFTIYEFTTNIEVGLIKGKEMIKHLNWRAGSPLSEGPRAPVKANHYFRCEDNNQQVVGHRVVNL